MPLKNTNSRDMARYHQEIQGLDYGLSGGAMTVSEAQTRENKVVRDQLDTLIKEGDTQRGLNYQAIRQQMTMSTEKTRVAQREIHHNYFMNRQDIEKGRDHLLESFGAGKSNEEFADACFQNQMFFKNLEVVHDATYSSISETQKISAERDQREWDNIDMSMTLSDRCSDEGLRRLTANVELMATLAKHHLGYWSSVVERAIETRRALEQIDLAVRQQDEKERDSEHGRGLADKQQALDEYIQRTELRMKEVSEIKADDRAYAQQKHQNQLASDQRRDDAGFKEIESYVKNKLVGQGRYYKFTRSRGAH